MNSFHPFPRLPPELRREIWDLSIVPRQVDLHVVFDLQVQPWCDRDASGWPDSAFPEAFCIRSCNTMTPPALQACRESRAHLESVEGGYAKAFAGGQEPIYTWVNFALDTIALDTIALDTIALDTIALDAARFVDEGWSEVMSEEAVRIVRLRLTHAEILGQFFQEHGFLESYVRGLNIKELTLHDDWKGSDYLDYTWLQV
ncbi:hypothetical protein PG985_001497 [Apiospora marii]|uniref:2EXR domain-containing protein n=1 Tax=Apiospora marii TaxID=335849 RepID=A0ABR1RI35_9PEZI